MECSELVHGVTPSDGIDVFIPSLYLPHTGEAGKGNFRNLPGL